MRKAAVALLAGAYIFGALSVAALFWRMGAGWPLELTGFAGVLGLAFAVHNLIGRGLDHAALRRELETLREAHRILADHIESAQVAMETLTEAVQTETVERTQAIVSEVRMLEDLVARMGETLQDRLAPAEPAYGRGPERSGPERPGPERSGPERSGHARSAPARSGHDRRDRGPERPHERYDDRGPSQAGDRQGDRQVDRQRAILLDTVREALAEGRVDLYLQPVVSLPQRRTAFYEGFSRLRDEDGRVLMPAEYLTVAEPEGLITAIDNLLLFRCVQIVRRLAKQDRRVGIFCNLSLASLGDAQFFPQFLEFLGQNRDLAGSLIFELGQKSFRERGGLEARNMAKLADLGFRFSMDKVVDLNLDFSDLARADVKFVRIAARTLIEDLVDDEGRIRAPMMNGMDASDFAALTRRFGVEVIAEKVETERQVVEVLELDIALGQGNLFGEPRAIREAVLSEAAPPSDVLRGALRRSVGR